MEQILSTGRALFKPRRQNSAKNETSASATTAQPEATPTTLFPISELLEQLLRQEAELWKKNEGLPSTIKVAGIGGVEQETADPPSLQGGLVPPPTPTPSPSLTTSPTPTPTATPPLSSRTPPNTRDSDRDKALCLVNYGTLTDDIHRYFRRLEKRHACLYLTKRRAKHENLRHVETQARPEQDGAEAQSAGYLLRNGGGQDGQLVTLREEELLVFRAALMCAQFPMLSAPNPPEGGSPTPTPPVIPFSTIGTPDAGDLSRTAPSELHNDKLMRQSGAGDARGRGVFGFGSPSGKTSPRIRRSSSERKKRGRPRESQGSPDSASKGVAPGVDAEGDSKGLTSEPASDRGKTKSGLRRVHSTSSTSSRKLTKRLSMDLANTLPPVVSDEDDELAELSQPRTLHSRDSAHLVGREHPFSPMVNREMLCSLVRRAFKQTEEQQLQFEQILKHDYGRRSKGEILAKELAGQLQVLENNAHPFYKPKLFVTRNGYDQWLAAEKQRVRSLIDKFWHFSLPRPQLWRHYNPTDYHRAYSLLLTRIICCESRTERREPVHAGKTPSSPLSPTAQRLLNEFGLRYGVGELYRKIVYLDYLARHFDYEVWYIRHCTEELRAIRNLLPRNRNKITAVRKEMDLLKTTVHLLHGQTDNCLTKIDRLFQDSPTEGVASLIELLAEVLDAELSLFGKRVLTVEEWLKRYLKRGFALRYERRKEIHADETMHTRTAKPFVPTPALVNALLLSIKDEVRDYRDKFQPVFRPYFDIVPFARMEFYRLMCSDACSLCLRTIHKPETRTRLNLEMLGLLYRLNERDNEWENVIPPDMQQWRHSFVDLSLIWMEVLGKQINKWVLTSVSRDKWTLLTFSIDPSGTDAGLPTIPTRAMGVRAGISSSPFPSPGYTPMAHTPHSVVGSIGSNGAFMPYHKLMREDQHRDPLKSASSSRSGHNQSPDLRGAVAEIPDIVIRGAKLHVSNPSRPSPQDNIMQFWQTGRNNGLSNRDELEHSSTVEPAHEIEVSASVYGSREESPIAHEAVHSTSSGEDPLSDMNVNQSPQSNTGLEDEASPPPLPSPVEENEAVGHCVDSEGDGGVVGGGESRESEKGGEGEATTRALLTPDTPVKAENHLASGGNDSTAAGTTLEEKDKEEGDVPALSTDQQEKTQQSSSHSEYHTPSPPSEDELQGLPKDQPTIETLPPITDTLATGEGEDRNRHQDTGENHTDGIVFLSHNFPPASPVEFDDQLHINEERVVQPKPMAHATGTDKATMNPNLHTSALGSESTPAITVTRETGFPEDISVVSSTASSYLDTSQHLPKEYSSLSVDHHSDVEESAIHAVGKGRKADSSSGLDWKVNALLQKDNPYLFPISNSPMDIVTMLTRLACFTSTLLNTLTPKLRHGAVPGLDEPRRVHDYAPDVAMAKRQASQQLKHIENTHTEFLKKLHKIMYNSLKLYADNLLCMDLCCWSNAEAVDLLGSEMVHHLQRRRDMREIWGCRHMVEVRHGLHPNGIPCHKKKSIKFESITRDMCLRINNIHLLISIFPMFESHLHLTTRKESPKPHAATAFGYISSDVGDRSSPFHRPHAPHSGVGASVRRLRTSRDPQGLAGTSSDPSLMPRSSSLSWGHSSREGDVPPEKPEAGFASRDSDQLLEYLRNIQKVQLKLLCSRMNKFFKPALSLLLELKLGDCSIERRLHPLITFLTRHRSALQKYIYPECFHTLMDHLWNSILQDLEEEAIKLKESKRPVTERAQLLLQALSHLIVFINDKEEGVPLQTLTPSCEYLLALLDVMTRSTDQLITIYNKLSTPQFAMSRLDLTQAPVPIDPTVVHTLRSQLHTFKKCFSGKDFVEQFLKLGREAESLRVSSSEPTTPSPQIGSHRHQYSPAGLGGRHAFDSTGAKISYSVHYAKEVAQYMLNERIMLPLPSMRQGSSEGDSDDGREGVASCQLHESSSFKSDQNARQTVEDNDSSGAIVKKHFSENGPELASSRYTHSYRTALQESDSTTQLVSHIFIYSPQSLYKFSDVEDFESHTLYHSLILSSSTNPQAVNNLEETTAFERARLGTLFLVHDLLLQRARKEKRAKQFLQTPHALTVAERRKQEHAHVDCNLIFKL